MKNSIFLAGFLIFLISSCTVEKRLYRNGLNIQWHAINGLSKNEKSIMYEEKDDAQVSSSISKNIINNFAKVSDLEENKLDFSTSDIASISNDELLIIDSKTLPTKEIVNKTNVNKADNNAGIQSHVIKNIDLNHKKKVYPGDPFYMILLFVFCFLLPPLAVFIVTDGDFYTTIINVILTLLCWIPGVIHALITVSRNV